MRSNTFHYTFRLIRNDDPKQQQLIIPYIIPTTYQEAMSFLEGKRRLELN